MQVFVAAEMAAIKEEQKDTRDNIMQLSAADCRIETKDCNGSVLVMIHPPGHLATVDWDAIFQNRAIFQLASSEAFSEGRADYYPSLVGGDGA